MNEFKSLFSKSIVLLRYRKSHFKLCPTFSISEDKNSFLSKAIVLSDVPSLMKSMMNTFLFAES